MKNKKRQDFVKPLCLLSILSPLVLIICLLVGLVVATYVNIGFFFVALGFVIFIVLHIFQYRMLYTCRCRKCGHVEVFETKWMIITGVKKRCPKCDAKLKIEEIIE
jgi:hypothetical protein